MRSFLREAFIGAGMILALVGIVFGAVLPLLKAQYYIRATKMQIRSVAQFTQEFDKVFGFYSPVGDEEIGKFLAGNVFPVIANPQQSKEISQEVLAYIEKHLQADNVRHLLLLGRMRYALWQNFGDRNDAEKAEEYYFRAHEIAPRLPQPLYGLYDVYRDAGDEKRLRVVAERILGSWPDANISSGVIEE